MRGSQGEWKGNGRVLKTHGKSFTSDTLWLFSQATCQGITMLGGENILFQRVSENSVLIPNTSRSSQSLKGFAEHNC